MTSTIPLPCCWCGRMCDVLVAVDAVYDCQCGRRFRVQVKWYTAPVYGHQPYSQCEDSAPLDYGKVFGDQE